MKPTQNLPDNYALAWKLDLKHNTRLNVILQILALVWMALAGWLLISNLLSFSGFVGYYWSNLWQVQSVILVPLIFTHFSRTQLYAVNKRSIRCQ